MEAALKRKILAYFFALAILTYPTLASAYIGPGLGLGAIAVVLGIVSGLLMLVVGVVWYPLRRFVRRLWPKKWPSSF